MLSNHHDWTGLRPPDRFSYSPVVVEAAGELACFTRPEMTSERLSYPIMTPPAAQGLLTAVFWKPQIRYVIECIEVLSPPRWTTLRRNEAASGITREMVKHGGLHIEGEMNQQRMTTLLRDVHYRIHAQVWVHPEAQEQNPAKWRDQLMRRVHRGQSFRTPFLGMRELHADVQPATDAAPLQEWSEQLGVMLHSITYDEMRGSETYDWFDAQISKGVMEVPRQGLMADRQTHAQRQEAMR